MNKNANKSPSTIPGKALGLLLITSLLPSVSQALLFDQNVTPDVIYGSGNANGSFTVDRFNGVELGLRTKIPFVGTVNSNGDGSYSYTAGEIWNFDWTVNTNYEFSTGYVISDLTYQLGIDFDPSAATNFLVFDPITQSPLNPSPDHSIGNNTTANGAGVEAVNAADYALLTSTNNVIQQSWRHDFFTSIPGFDYDENIAGTYDIYLTAFNQGTEVASTRIQVLVATPEPTVFALLSLGLAGIGFSRRGNRK